METSTHSEPEEKRTRKKASLDPTICPVCSLTIRENELQSHFKMELEKLGKVRKLPTMVNRSPSTSTSPGTSTKAGNKSDEASTSAEIDTWTTFQKIKENRVRRTTRLRNRKRKAEDQTCPVCNKTVIEDLQLHVEICLKSQQQTSDDSDGDIDVGESYTWCGQTRIRATTLIEGSLSSAGVGTVLARSNEDEDTEVNIDGDEDNQVYGNAQYSERDVILLNQDDQRLRDLVIGEQAPATSTEAREENNQNVANNASRSESPCSDKMMDIDNNTEKSCDNEQSSSQVIESLKARIREYEKFIRNKPKCLICLDDFKKPVVSICCWHVHCEECWLYTLGCRKLCPQCNMITTAADLRRIYL